MIVLHGIFDQGFSIWGERSFTEPDLHGLSRMRWPKSDTVYDHAWAADAELIFEALTDSGYKYKGDVSGKKMEIVLPTLAGKYPVPSSPILGEIPAGYINSKKAPVLRRWSVDSISLDISGTIGLMPIADAGSPVSDDGCLISHGVMMALDLCYILECCRFVISLLSRGRFLPDIGIARAPGREIKYESMWKPFLIGEDAKRFGKLAAMVPGILGACRTPGEDGSGLTAEILGFLTDSLIRESWTKKSKSAGEQCAAPSPGSLAIHLYTPPDALVAEKKRRGRLVNALNPHALWARSLGWLGETDGLSQSLESIYEDVRNWCNRFEWFSKAPFNFRLKMHDEPNEAGVWRADYSIRHLETKGIIEARDVWSWPQEYGGILGGYMRRYMLLLLGYIGKIMPAIERSLDEYAPCSCSMSLREASEFLETQASDFINVGIEVEHPGWWSESTPDKLTIRGRLILGRINKALFDDFDYVCKNGLRSEKLAFNWEIALHGDILSEEELEAVSGKFPLVRIKGRWSFIHASRLKGLTERIKALPQCLDAVEALRLALRDPYIDGFADSPELEAIYDSLKECRSPKPLEVPKKINVTLRPYQERGYAWLSLLSHLGLGACLADDMGLGKTVQALATVQRHRDAGNTGPVLLVCPTSVLENWRIETARFFPRMTPYLHHGRTRTKGSAFEHIARKYAVVMTSYALLQRDASTIQAVKWMGVILDEAQNIKNPQTRQARTCRNLNSEWRIVLTGTPIENHVGDLWSIMEFLMPGMLGSRRFFTKTYVKPIQKGHDEALLRSLKRIVSPFIMRRMKSDRDIVPDLPRKIETKVFCGLKKEQARLYTAIVSGLEKNLAGANGIRRKGIVLSALTRIKQVCDHPSLVFKDCDFSTNRSAKLERMLALAEVMFEAGDKTLIFTQYVEMGSIIKYQLQEAFGREVLFLHGSVPKDARDRMVERFQNEEGARFFVLSMKAGGVGLNLTGANHVVMFDRWWNPAVETQAIDRAYRIGQTRNVHVHIFCCRGTLEERIDELISSKRSISSKVIDGNDNWITELSDRELQRLLSLSPSAAEA